MTKDRKGLSAAKVKSAATPGKYYDQHGLFLRVEESGSKRWVQRITIGGKQREIGLGSASLVSLADAREVALENRKLARIGRDPIAERNKASEVPTFDAAVTTVHAMHLPTWRNAKHAAQFLSTLREYVSPRFGCRRVSEVTSADVLAALSPIWTTKPETARRVKQRIGVVMKWAIAQGHRTDDPSLTIAQALPKQGKTQSHRKSMHYDAVFACIDAVRGSGAMLSTKLAIEFLVLTAARSGEVRGATWDEFDLDREIWTIPAARMKAGAEHVVPLSDTAVAVLRQAKELGSEGLVFPGQKPGRPMSDMTMSKLVKELGFDTDVHGFRTSFRVWVQEKTNTPFEVAEKALAHTTSNKVVAAYARSDLFEKRRALMEAWAQFLNNDSAKVVRLGASA